MHPNIQQQIQTKKSYDSHIQKLTQIREGRKNSLRNNGFSSRTHSNSINNHYPYSYNSQYAYNHVLPYDKLAHIVQKKHQTFIKGFNKQQQKISTENWKLFEKLNKETNRKSRKDNNYHYYSKGSQSSRNYQHNLAKYNFDISNTITYTPYDGKKTFIKVQTQRSVQKENQRLQNKIKSCSSSLSYSKLMSSQKNRQQLRTRILRYDEGLQLKSSKYVKPLSAGSGLNQTLRSTNKSQNQDVSDKRIQSARGNIGKFYDYKDIKRNRINNYKPKISSVGERNPLSHNMLSSERRKVEQYKVTQTRPNLNSQSNRKGRSFFTTAL